MHKRKRGVNITVIHQIIRIDPGISHNSCQHFSKEIIQRAYEVTISNIQKPSLSYANAILRNWHEGGLHTLEEVNTALAEYRKAKEQQPDGSSFNTDDFFQAALRQSYTAENPKEPQNAHA